MSIVPRSSNELHLLDVFSGNKTFALASYSLHPATYSVRSVAVFFLYWIVSDESVSISNG